MAINIGVSILAEGIGTGVKLAKQAAKAGRAAATAERTNAPLRDFLSRFPRPEEVAVNGETSGSEKTTNILKRVLLKKCPLNELDIFNSVFDDFFQGNDRNLISWITQNGQRDGLEFLKTVFREEAVDKFLSFFPKDSLNAEQARVVNQIIDQASLGELVAFVCNEFGDSAALLEMVIRSFGNTNQVNVEFLSAMRQFARLVPTLQISEDLKNELVTALNVLKAKPDDVIFLRDVMIKIRNIVSQNKDLGISPSFINIVTPDRIFDELKEALGVEWTYFQMLQMFFLGPISTSVTADGAVVITAQWAAVLKAIFEDNNEIINALKNLAMVSNYLFTRSFDNLVATPITISAFNFKAASRPTALVGGGLLLNPWSAQMLIAQLTQNQNQVTKEAKLLNSADDTTTEKFVLYAKVYLTSLYLSQNKGTPEQQEILRVIRDFDLLALHEMNYYGKFGFGYYVDSDKAWESVADNQDAVAKACVVSKNATANISASQKAYPNLPDSLYSTNFSDHCDNYGASRQIWTAQQPWTYEYANYAPKYKTGEQGYTTNCNTVMTNYFKAITFDKANVVECELFGIHNKEWAKAQSWFAVDTKLQEWWNFNEKYLKAFKYALPITEISYAKNNEVLLGADSTRHKYIKDLILIGEKSKDEAIATLKKKGAQYYLDQDLNESAKGKFLYLGFTTTDDENLAITNIKVESNTTAGVNTLGKKKIDGVEYQYICGSLHNADNPGTDNSTCLGQPTDLNVGASGKYVYLYASHDKSAGKPLVNIGLQNETKNKFTFTLDNTWKKIDGDANEGVKGSDNIYFYQRHNDGR
jgi:hypothetical protein